MTYLRNKYIYEQKIYHTKFKLCSYKKELIQWTDIHEASTSIRRYSES